MGGERVDWGTMDDGRIKHLEMIQEAIGRMAKCSFQLKGWAATLAVALVVFLKGEASPAYLFVPALPVVAFWLLDGWYLRQERLFRALYDKVRAKTGPSDFAMDKERLRGKVPSVLRVAVSPTVLGLYGPVLLGIVVLALVLPG